MKKQILETLKNEKAQLIEFARELVKIKSYSGEEEQIIKHIAKKMEGLGFDEVFLDSMGNVLGRIGSGKTSIMFDSHVDTVAVKDETLWEYPPFEGVVDNNYLHGRGSVDMKSAAAASIYGAIIARRLGLDSGKTIYITCTVQEEDCDGENLKHMFKEKNIIPDYFFTCEPSGNKIVTGHKGKIQVSIKTRGISAHGSAPEKGRNAIYEMAEIIQRAEKTNEALLQQEGPKRTLVMSKITSQSVSLNAVPFACEAYLDRRTVPGETEAQIQAEMNQIVEGKDATWEVDEIKKNSWTGMPVTYRPFHPAWETGINQEPVKTCTETYREYFDSEPLYDYWDFSTNAVTPVSMGIPSAGFGPGNYKLAHCRDEKCSLEEIIDACGFYALLIGRLPSA